MSKTIKNCYYKKLTYDNLYSAYMRASLNKRNKIAVIKFSIDLETYLSNIYNDLYNNCYESSEYREFIIYEPKKRIIRALPFKDRIVHQWYIEEFIKPYIVPRFINDSYACIIGKGTHQAIFKLNKYMRIMNNRYGDYYIIKFDISKYFESIDKNILYDIMKKYISDKYLLNLTHNIIFDNDFNGIPIGNYTSQYFANIYLNELDYYVKYDLRLEFYVRYMDDFIILVKNKEEAKRIFNLVELFVNNRLNLKLNKKSRYYPSRLGCDFCGYILYNDYRLIRKRSIKGMRNKIYNFNNKKITFDDINLSFISWCGHARHANSYKVISDFYGCIYK
jgi:RNA-directed DNA polymerase